MRRIPLTQSQAGRIKNSLSSLRFCVQDLDKQIKERTSYDERMEYFNSNVKDLTTLVQTRNPGLCLSGNFQFCDCTDGTEPE